MAERKLPVDFEKKAKQSPRPNGSGYPYQLSAKDLMDNFKYLLTILPEGEEGDMLRWEGDAWVLLTAPSGGQSNLLFHDGTTPEWIPGGGDLDMRGIGANIIASEAGSEGDKNTQYTFTLLPNPHHILSWRKGVFVGKFPAGEDPPPGENLITEDYVFTYMDGPTT